MEPHLYPCVLHALLHNGIESEESVCSEGLYWKIAAGQCTVSTDAPFCLNWQLFGSHTILRKAAVNLQCAKMNKRKHSPSWKCCTISTKISINVYIKKKKTKVKYKFYSFKVLAISFTYKHVFFFLSIEIEDSEAVGISNIISNLITTFPRSILTALPSDLFSSFINCLTLLTCSFGRSAALEEVVSSKPFDCIGCLYKSI